MGGSGPTEPGDSSYSHTASQHSNNTSFLRLFMSPYGTFCPHLLCASLKTPPLWFRRIFPESLRWLLATQHYRRSKAMMLRIARKNQVDLTTEPNGVLAGEDHSKDQNTNIYLCFSTVQHCIQQIKRKLRLLISYLRDLIL